jgi:ABC-type polysaccharide/polyol phosphate transport system ATPase subunit
MSDVVIRAEGLGKKYLIGHQAQNERYTALRDVIARNLNGLMRSARDMLRGRQLIQGGEVEEFWALKDVNFEIHRGDVVGIIGRNGAGKSTLLKILSRITEPSSGRVEIKGRVASLLEVGTGFHPELSGRENIFLNGAILGMSRRDITRNFDEIVAFAEVEKFLDTPVKRYSSGMYVRLAFAVAAHLEPEILVVDEVLAVGDAEFQQKCLGKMGEISAQGRTVLFVSHNVNAIKRLCKSVIVLQHGSVAKITDSADAGISYYNSMSKNYDNIWRRQANELANDYFIPTLLAVEDANNPNATDVKVIIEGDVQQPHRLLNMFITLKTLDGETILVSSPRDHLEHSWNIKPGCIQLCCHIPKRLININRYIIELASVLHGQQYLWSDSVAPSIIFEVTTRDDISEFWGDRRIGFAPILAWDVTSSFDQQKAGIARWHCHLDSGEDKQW